MDFWTLLEERPGYVQEDTPPPVLPLFAAFLLVRAAVQVFHSWLDTRQHLMYDPKVDVPKPLTSALERLDEESRQNPSDRAPNDEGLLQRTLDGFHKSQAYGKDKSTLRIASSLVTFVVDGLFLLAGGYPFAWDLARKAVRDWQLPDSDDITTSLLWTGLLITFDHLYHLPLELYRIFVIEERHGFNKQTIGMFVADKLKQAFLLVVIGGPILALVIKVILWGGEHFYVYVYAVVFVVQVVMVVLYPTLIAPLFNKFTPLENGDLKAAIERLAESQKFPLRKLYVMDASRRSGHSNAYFYGFCNNKRIVLYDTLLKQQDNEEVVAVLAHELGHWKKSHTLKMLAIAQVQLFATFVLFSRAIKSSSLYHSFGFREFPVIVGLFLFNEVVFTPLGPLINFMGSVVSRRYEFQADAFACGLGMKRPLQTGLVKLQIENMGSLAVDPLYSAYHYSHPPLVERLCAMETVSVTAGTSSKKLD